MAKTKKTPLEYKLNSEYRDAMSRHARMTASPKERLGMPLTTSQLIGWEDEMKMESTKVYKPLVTSYETRYADAMAKSGAIF